MPQSLAKILVHTAFSTKNRALLLPAEPFVALHKYAFGLIAEQKCHMIEMNNVADHVHILFDLHRAKCASEVIMHVKKGTSRWIKEQDPKYRGFDWQDGFGAFSIGQSQRPAVRSYIRAQQEHHRVRTFQDEFRELLRLYEIEFDERYVWDRPNRCIGRTPSGCLTSATLYPGRRFGRCRVGRSPCAVLLGPFGA